MGLSATGNGSITVNDGLAAVSTAQVTGNAIVSVSDAPSTTSSGQATTSYTYNGAAGLTTVSSPVLAACYTYNGDGLRSTSVTDGLTKTFTWDTSTDQLLSDGQYDYIYGPGGALVEEVAVGTNTPTFVHTDNLGSVRLLTNGHGAVVGSATYNATW